MKSFWALSFNWKHNFGCCPTQHLLFGNLIKYSWNIRELEKNKFSTLKPSQNIVGSNSNQRKKTSWGWSCANLKFSWGLFLHSTWSELYPNELTELSAGQFQQLRLAEEVNLIYVKADELFVSSKKWFYLYKLISIYVTKLLGKWP